MEEPFKEKAGKALHTSLLIVKSTLFFSHFASLELSKTLSPLGLPKVSPRTLGD
jgi:hypothetical protein